MGERINIFYIFYVSRGYTYSRGLSVRKPWQTTYIGKWYPKKWTGDISAKYNHLLDDVKLQT